MIGEIEGIIYWKEVKPEERDSLHIETTLTKVSLISWQYWREDFKEQGKPIIQVK